MRNFSLKTLFFLWPCFFLAPSQAMIGNQKGNKPYVQIAQHHPLCDSVCLIHDPTSGVSQTGVLIGQNIVATAAHGMKTIFQHRNIPAGTSCLALQKKLNVTFLKNNTPIIHQGTKIIIDDRYLGEILGSEAKYDIAYIKLDKDVQSITPAPLLDQIPHQGDELLVVLTMGTADLFRSLLMKRGFYLYEVDRFYPSSFDESFIEPNRSVLFSSLFFEENFSPPSARDDPITQRAKEATQRWLANNQGAYGLALPGTSGAPVFIQIEGKYYLFGLLTSFSATDNSSDFAFKKGDIAAIISNQHHAKNRYQNIFALFYKEAQLAQLKPHEKALYKIDPYVQRVINIFNGNPLS